jgi:peptidoglycan/xylan/chitin deacetylase (PgdA/CDA1 family)
MPRRTADQRSEGARSPSMPAIMMYHSISPYEQDPYLITVSPRRFERQMDWLRRRGLRGVSVAELVAARERGHARRLVGLTFDDGYTDFLEYALQVLTAHRFTATVFVLAGRLGGENSWDAEGPRKPLMTARQVRQAADAGMEIGSHGLRHISLPTADRATLTAETENSRAVLQAASGQEVTGFCYPYGHLDGRVVEAVAAAGYSYGCAIWRSAHTGRLALPRIYVGDSDSSWRLWAKAARQWLTWEYRGPGARRLSGAAGGHGCAPGSPPGPAAATVLAASAPTSFRHSA